MVPEDHEQARRCYRRAEQLTFTGAGHVPHQTHPDEYVRAVVEFIQARDRSADL
jgi:pimeloyl-ACP methyl ester carboxylesterase